jgi:hypothetical protein
MPAANPNDRELRIDIRLDSYRSFLDHRWVQDINRVVKGTKLDLPIFDLTFSWKGSANARRMPSMMIDVLKSWTDGYTRARKPFPQEVVESFSAKVAENIKDPPLSEVQRRQMTSFLREVEDSIRRKLDEDPFSVDDYLIGFWKWLIEGEAKSETCLALWKSEVNAYVGIYYAYEDFLRQCMCIAKARQDYRIKFKSFGDDLAAEFNDGIRDLCWFDEKVNVSRLVRNAVLHNGARLTPELAPLKHHLNVRGDEIDVMAPDTTQLFELLKVRVAAFVSEALKQSRFH